MAGLWERLSGALGWIPPEEEYIDEDNEHFDLGDPEDSWEEYEHREFVDSEEELRDNPRERSRPSARVVSLPSGKPKSVRVAVTEPRGYEEVQGLADQLKRRVAVVVNVEQLDRGVARRVVDFLSGTVYSLDGEMQQVSSEVVLFVPREMHIEVMEGAGKGDEEPQEYL
ncbi:MAG: cell division protein SepF [Bacillota bacterium]